MTIEIPWSKLLESANRTRTNAHAPYSNYKVGAAILSGTGRIYTGCNVENASYGLTLCAERNALGQLVASGETALRAVAVVTEGPEAGTPCGLCRQALTEFEDDVPIALAVVGEAEARMITSLAELFPKPFRLDWARRSSRT